MAGLCETSLRRRVTSALPALWLALSVLSLPAAAAAERPAQAAAAGEATTSLRVVTLAPHLAELVFAVGAGDLLVGVSAYTDHPVEAAGLPVVGDAFAVDQERLALLQPDLLLAWKSGTPANIVDRLAARGYRIEVIETRALDDVATALLRIGRLTGHDAEAERTAGEFRDGLQRLAAAYRDSDPIRVFYQISSRPLYTVNGAHYVSELIAKCGGRNIFADLDALAPLVDVEAVLARDPEAMLASEDSGSEAFGVWGRWPELAANRYNNYFFLPASEIGRATPRLLQAGETLCRTLDRARDNRKE